MTDSGRALRRARQMIETDRLLGADTVPVDPAAAVTEPIRVDSADSPPQPDRSISASRRVAPPRQAATPTQPAPPPAMPAMKAVNMTLDEKIAALAALEQEIAAWLEDNWERNGWNNVVFGEGDPDADLMFVGEGPGADEDKQGRPFVGRAGQLLDKQITAMGLQREQVYIGNIVKTRPPGNRVPTPDEAAMCMPFLIKQIEIIQPKVIVTLGATATKYLLGNPKIAITRERGNWKQWQGVEVMPTFHPAYLLRQYTPDNRRKVWDDLQKVLERLGLPVPG